MTAKIIAIPGVTERFQLNTARSQDLADLEVQLQKVATQIQRIHEE